MENDVKTLKNELQNIICRAGSNSETTLIKTIQAYLRAGAEAGKDAETKQYSKPNEERALIDFINTNSLWVTSQSWGTYLTEGAEQKIYFPDTEDCVLKVADGIFYQSWLDYFNNLLIHNYLFPDTTYTLVGFNNDNHKLYAILKQPFIATDEITNLDNVKDFMLSNGFKHKKGNDYYHDDLGLIIEDLHDENVLTKNGVLYFVDTVIYLAQTFYTNR